MRSLRSIFVVGSVLAVGPYAVGCSATSDDVESSEADLSTSQFDQACSAPVRSEDGKYLAIDLCPKDKTPGRIVRVDIATGTQTEVATYAANDRVERLATMGPSFFFGVRHAVDGNGRATTGVDVGVRDWALTTGRTISAAAPSGVSGSFSALQTLVLTADGSHVAFSAADGPLATFLFVAPVMGATKPVALDLGIASTVLRWSTAGGSLVGHDVDDVPSTGETLVLIETGGENVATLVGTRHVEWNSFAFAQGGTRPQEPFDGTRVLGFKTTPSLQSIGTVDPRTGEETVLDSAPLLGIVTDLGSDVLYARVTEVPGAGGFIRELVKQPRAGGAKTVLVTTSASVRDELRYGFDPLAVTKTGAYGLFGTRTGASGGDERFLVKLDGSAAAVKLGDKVRMLQQVGDLVLIEDATNAPAVFQTLDLGTGTFTTIGPSSGAGAFVNLVGDGSIVQLDQCSTEAGTLGLTVRHTTPSGSDRSPCAWMPWASIPMAIAGSDALVFYSSWGPFPNYRYDIGIVKP